MAAYSSDSLPASQPEPQAKLLLRAGMVRMCSPAQMTTRHYFSDRNINEQKIITARKDERSNVDKRENRNVERKEQHKTFFFIVQNLYQENPPCPIFRRIISSLARLSTSVGSWFHFGARRNDFFTQKVPREPWEPLRKQCQIAFTRPQRTCPPLRQKRILATDPILVWGAFFRMHYFLPENGRNMRRSMAKMAFVVHAGSLAVAICR